MKDIINIVLLAFVIISILCQPLFLVHGMNTFLGKMITLIVIIGATMYHTMSGLLLALLFICFRMIHVEGMENKKEQVTDLPNDSIEEILKLEDKLHEIRKAAGKKGRSQKVEKDW